MAFTALSPDFEDGAVVPRRFTCDGDDAAPQVTFDSAPEGTRSFALIVDDPDAPHGTFTHWLAYDIPPHGPDVRTSQGKTLENDFGRIGYGGPCPPRGHGAHRYYFTLYAVDVAELQVTHGDRKNLEKALSAHTLATARFMGRYERGR